MYGLTIGQELGIYPLWSTIPPRYQFKSRNDGLWKDCKNKWDMNQYKKYGYETREFFT